MLPAEDDDEFCLPSSLQSKPDSIAHENGIGVMQAILDEQPCTQILQPRCLVNPQSIAENLGRVVYGDSDLLKRFSSYWDGLGRNRYYKRTKNSIAKGNGECFIKMLQGGCKQYLKNDTHQEEKTCSESYMAVHSEGIMLERSIVIGRDESYHFPQHYHRTRPCGDKFNFQDSCGSERKVSAGQFGTVYHAVDVSSQRRVEPVFFAEKVVPLEKFRENELSILSSVDHGHIVKLYGAIRTPDGIHIMMQLAPGGNVDHLLREEKGFDGGSEDPRLFTEFWALLYYKQVMDALDYLQSLRIVHCDVKPRNVVLSSDHQRCFLTDFGEARYIPFSKPYFQLKSELVGTINFMSPEVIEEEKFYFESDVWSAACFLLNMLTGFSPWTKSFPGLGTYLFVIPQRPYRVLDEIPPWVHSLTTSILKSSFMPVSDRISAKELLQLAERNIKTLSGLLQSTKKSEATSSESENSQRPSEETVDASTPEEVIISMGERVSAESSALDELSHLIEEFKTTELDGADQLPEDNIDINYLAELQELIRREGSVPEEVVGSAVVGEAALS